MREFRTCAPAAVFVYRRADYTKKTLLALRKNFLAAQTDLYIFSDGAKGESDRQDVDDVRNFVRSFAARDDFRSVHVNLASQNRGLAFSVISGAGELLRKFGRVIVLEDDLVTGRDFLTFMNDGLDYYAENGKIWSISGYTPPLKSLNRWKRDIYFFYRASSWGWATWADRWEMTDWEMQDYDRFLKSPEKIARLRRGGSDMPKMLQRQMEGEIDSWAIRWCYAQSMEDLWTVFPRISRVRNLGNDGSGTHTPAVASEFDTRLNENFAPCHFFPPDGVNARLAGEFRLLYDAGVRGKLNRRFQRLKIRGGNCVRQRLEQWKRKKRTDECGKR